MVAIFVVLTILVCLSIDAVLQKRRASAHRATQVAPAPATTGLPFQSQPSENTFFHPGHTWMQTVQRQSHAARVGIDAFITYILGKADQIYLPPVGAHIRQGDPLLTLMQNGRKLDLPAPISGIISTHNPHLNTVQQRPTTAEDTGWICDMRPTRLDEEHHILTSASAARAWFESELKRLGEWLTQQHAPQPGMALQDGGLPTAGVLAHLNDAEWANFQTQFLGK